MRKFVAGLFLGMVCSLPFIATGEARAAQSGKPVSEENTATARVIGAANERLKAQVEALAGENNALKEKLAALEVETVSMNRDRAAILDKMKMIVKENTQLKDQTGSLPGDAVSPNPAKGTIPPPVVIGKSGEEAPSYLEENKKLKEELKAARSIAYGTKRDSTRLRKETADMHYNLGVILQGQDKFDEAIQEYKKSLEILPEDAATHLNLALLYDHVKNDRAKAIEHYRKYIETDPKEANVLEVKERLNDLEVENKVWGEPNETGIGEKTGRWRFQGKKD